MSFNAQPLTLNLIVLVRVCLVFLGRLFILSETSWYFLPESYLAASLHHPVPHQRVPAKSILTLTHAACMPVVSDTSIEMNTPFP
ncbi:hypothetical protein BJ165DRAFT_1503837 [Panaeolus papilionaceus]|nr:hypothetical protein BJ165DRAFT_1503837 [Panaeolus papilionaceus]